MDEGFKLDLDPQAKKFTPLLEQLPIGTYNFKIVAAYPHTTKTNKKAFKFELMALDSDSPAFGKNVHKLNFLSHALGKNFLMRELKAIGVNVEAWADPISGVIEAAELEAQLAAVGNEIHGKVVTALKSRRPNSTGGDWHELQITGLSTVEAPSAAEDLPF